MTKPFIATVLDGIVPHEISPEAGSSILADAIAPEISLQSPSGLRERIANRFLILLETYRVGRSARREVEAMIVRMFTLASEQEYSSLDVLADAK